jgi:hypothetical protein
LTSRRTLVLVVADRPTTSRWVPPATPRANAPISSGRSRRHPTRVDTSDKRHRRPGQDLRRVRPRFGL